MEKANTTSRVIAYLIDAVLCSVIGVFIPVIGGVASFFFFLFRDGIGKGLGVGKRLVNLKVVKEDGSPITYADSAKRNLIFAAPSLLLIIPFLGAVIYFVAALIVSLVESFCVLAKEDGRRIGDRMAGTKVIETETKNPKASKQTEAD